eukprot:3772310-Karenia_brevis.AAC.1
MMIIIVIIFVIIIVCMISVVVIIVVAAIISIIIIIRFILHLEEVRSDGTAVCPLAEVTNSPGITAVQQ